MYTWDEIEEAWLAGSPLALAREAIVEAFNIVEATFSRDWVENTRLRNGILIRGTSPTLHVANLGLWLSTLNGATGSEHLIEKLRAGDSDARAELAAIHLVCSGTPNLELELEPPLVVGAHNRRPDFRLRRTGEGWTYVEVTQPGTSATQADVHRGLKRLSDLAKTREGKYALEIFLKRDAGADEVEGIATAATAHRPSSEPETVELYDGLGTLYWNTTVPGQITLDDHGHPYTPRLGMMQSVMTAGEVIRHVAVRWPFTDTRAKKFLRHEASQLPTDAPGLVLIQTTNAVGAMKSWRRLMERLFQPSVYTRVSAVCLISSGVWPTAHGDEWRPQTKLVINPYAKIPLPGWIIDQLGRFPSDEEDLA